MAPPMRAAAVFSTSISSACQTRSSWQSSRPRKPQTPVRSMIGTEMKLWVPVLDEGLPGLAGHLVQGRLHDLAALARQRPVVQLAIRLAQRDVVIARIVADPGVAGLGPVVAAAFHRLAVGGLVELEQGDAGNVGGAAEAVQQFLDADPPVGDADDLRRGVGDGVQHGGAARQFGQGRGRVHRPVSRKSPFVHPAASPRINFRPMAANHTGRSLNDP